VLRSTDTPGHLVASFLTSVRVVRANPAEGSPSGGARSAVASRVAGMLGAPGHAPKCPHRPRVGATSWRWRSVETSRRPSMAFIVRASRPISSWTAGSGTRRCRSSACEGASAVRDRPKRQPGYDVADGAGRVSPSPSSSGSSWPCPLVEP
jgi:hypothetical protein